jgi:D-tyrosyl-tRNA(Tyr) deacylase
VIALLQRVSQAKVVVDDACTGEIGRGLLVLACAERGDTPREAQALMTKLLGYRVFPDDAGRMNRSLRDLPPDAGLLIVPQFTLAADTRSGTRPSFTPAAAPDDARRLFDTFVNLARAAYPRVETGVFGADMKVHLINDGPVTFWLQVSPGPVKDSA